MGGICGKPSTAVKDSEGNPKQRELSKKANKSQNSDCRSGLIDKKSNASRKVRGDYCEILSNRKFSDHFPGLGRVSESEELELISAGWPSWLVDEAGEAIRGWIPRKADTFEKLKKIGQGTYSSVYKGRDRVKNKIVALKKVRFNSTDPESVKFMAREILILRRLDHPNIIKLEGLVTSRTSSSLYLVFEYMEHDLTRLASLPGVKFTEPQIKCFMQQLLSGLDYCHSQGILHRDIKGSNILINNDGILKIADFGLANYYNTQKGARLTSRVVTLWYRPPELLLGAMQYGVGVDLWSAGCILGELYTGLPIMRGRTEVEQVHMIFKLCGSPSEDYWRNVKLPYSSVFKPSHPYEKKIADKFNNLPDVAIKFMETLLSIDASDRGTAETALKNEFFMTSPVACDPSSLPKYLPSKALDSELSEDKKGSSVVVDQPSQHHSIRSKDLLRVAPAPDPNAEMSRPMQRRQSQTYREILSDESVASNYPVVHQRPSRDSTQINKDHQPRDKAYKSGPLVPGAGRDMPISSRVKTTQSQIDQNRGQMFGGSQDKDYGRDGQEGQTQFSGPSDAGSSNVEKLLNVNDRRIQEAGRRVQQHFASNRL